MKTTIKYRLIDSVIFVYLCAFVLFLAKQIYIKNFRYSIINNLSISKCIIIFSIFLLLNGFTFFQFKKQNIFRILLIIQLDLIYIFTLFTLNGYISSYLYVPIILLAIFYTNNRIFNQFIYSYTLTVFAYITYIIYGLLKINNFNQSIDKYHLLHLFISVSVIATIVLIYDYYIKNLSSVYASNSQPQKESLDEDTLLPKPELTITSIEATNTVLHNQVDTVSNNLSKLIDTSDIITEAIQELKCDLKIVANNTKSINSLSCTVKRDFNALDTVTQQINTLTNQVKETLFSITDLFNTFLRTSFNISNSYECIKADLDSSKKQTDYLKDILVELEGLSLITTHLANETTIESKRTKTNDGVIQIIVKEFNDYAKCIKDKVNRMSDIFNSLDRDYLSCHREINQSANYIYTQNNIIKEMDKTLNTINNKFNTILNNISHLDGLFSITHNNISHLVADSSELDNAMHQFAKVSYSLSKIKGL